jgi:serine phosphatase RsbU (regulator of sigma subunit)
VFSDWVFEVEDGGGSMWGYDNLEDFVVLASGSGEPLLDRLVNRVTLLTQGRPLDDDFSILEVKFS